MTHAHDHAHVLAPGTDDMSATVRDLYIRTRRLYDELAHLERRISRLDTHAPAATAVAEDARHLRESLLSHQRHVLALSSFNSRALSRARVTSSHSPLSPSSPARETGMSPPPHWDRFGTQWEFAGVDAEGEIYWSAEPDGLLITNDELISRGPLWLTAPPSPTLTAEAESESEARDGAAA